MSNIRIHPDLNPLEVILVEDHMSKVAPLVNSYIMTKGNDCIWVFYDRHNIYYTFKDGKIHDIQID